MEPHDLERKYQPHLKRVGGLRLLPAAYAVDLLEDAKAVAVRLLGVEAFRLFDDGGVQPSMEFSNVSFGTVDRSGAFHAELRPREPWNTDPHLVSRTQELIREGASNGFEWFEVSLEDSSSERLLFFERSTE
jgi:hypothetical protein